MKSIPFYQLSKSDYTAFKKLNSKYGLILPQELREFFSSYSSLIKDNRQEAIINLSMASIFHRKADFINSQFYLNKVLEFSKNSPDIYARALSGFGMQYTQLGEFKNAENSYTQALDSGGLTSNYHALTQARLALVHLKTGLVKKAGYLCDKAVLNYTLLPNMDEDNQKNYLVIQNIYCSYCKKINQYSIAEKKYLQLVNLLNEWQYEDYYFSVYNNLASLYIHTHQFQNAENWLDKACNYIQIPTDDILFHLNMGEILWRQGRLQRGKKELLSALTIATEEDKARLKVSIYESLAELAAVEGNTVAEKEALNQIKIAIYGAGAKNGLHFELQEKLDWAMHRIHQFSLPVQPFILSCENLTWQEATQQFQRLLIIRRLNNTQWRKNRAHDSFGISNPLFFRYLNNLNISKKKPENNYLNLPSLETHLDYFTPLDYTGFTKAVKSFQADLIRHLATHCNHSIKELSRRINKSYTQTQNILKDLKLGLVIDWVKR
ncbi:MAG: hypothetical protein H8E85_03080 [Candidatus Marinimicrobia bacterium]|nr:hypothetical protein [Candidatus Neomarinimicrobiota bacterium]